MAQAPLLVFGQFPSVDIVDLKYLAASATAGNFGRAAKSLGLSTSTVSRRIGRLEDELGLALFERGHSGICVTAGGKAVVKMKPLAKLRTKSISDSLPVM